MPESFINIGCWLMLAAILVVYLASTFLVEDDVELEDMPYLRRMACYISYIVAVAAFLVGTWFLTVGIIAWIVGAVN